MYCVWMGFVFVVTKSPTSSATLGASLWSIRKVACSTTSFTSDGPCWMQCKWRRLRKVEGGTPVQKWKTVKPKAMEEEVGEKEEEERSGLPWNYTECSNHRRR